MEDEVVALVDTEGNFTEDYYSSLEDDIKDAPVIREAGNPKAMAKMLVNAQRKIGKNKVVLPGEDANPEEWHEFFKAAGKPDTPDDYQYKRPENIPEELRNADHLKELRNIAHERNWTQKQWQQYIKDDDARIAKEIETAELNADAETDAAEKQLKELWGMAYEERVHIANRLINETVDEKPGALQFSREDFVAKYGRDPMFIEWAASLGKTLVEHEALIAELNQTAPKEAQAELDEIMSTDEYTEFLTGELERKNPSRHKALLEKITKLNELLVTPAA